MSRQKSLSFEDNDILEQIKKSIENKRGLLDEDTLREYDDMKLIPSAEVRAGMADRLVNSLSSRMSSSWPILYQCLSLIRDYEIYKQPEFLAGALRKPFNTFEEYFRARLGQPYDLFVELEETYKFAQKHNKKWFNKEYQTVVDISRDQMIAQHIKEVKRKAAEAESEGKKINKSKIAKDVGVERHTVKKYLELTGNEGGTVPPSLPRKTQKQRAQELGVTPKHLRMLDKIAEHPDLQERTWTNADKKLSIVRAYSIARRREGKIIDPIKPLQKEFEKLDEADQKRFLLWVVDRAGGQTNVS